ncbi:YraN family protein [Aquimarina sp. AU474]|uniref:YraN family protein n=1 Tax=Aquimarina sp. AU474 TaxID=2108529 RepID=UPI000D692117|nr:YraN family protein [Aquimarina sp. AU474]
MAEHNALGRKGEEIAIKFLIDKGYQVLEKNYRYLKSEVDIIAKIKNVIVVVEVKTRSTPDFGNPQDFVKPKQIQSLVKAIDHYITEHDLDAEVRFDIVAIIRNKAGTKIEHLEDAFYHF